MLGDIYANGRGVPQNNTEAVTWLRRAAEQGHAVAQNNLGDMYENGWASAAAAAALSVTREDVESPHAA